MTAWEGLFQRALVKITMVLLILIKEVLVEHCMFNSSNQFLQFMLHLEVSASFCTFCTVFSKFFQAHMNCIEIDLSTISFNLFRQCSSHLLKVCLISWRVGIAQFLQPMEVSTNIFNPIMGLASLLMNITSNLKSQLLMYLVVNFAVLIVRPWAGAFEF
jgi:hypothetical protein